MADAGWELYVGKDRRLVLGLSPRRGQEAELRLRNLGGHKKTGPLLTDRRGYADGMPIRIWFSDVAVKVTGPDEWILAQ